MSKTYRQQFDEALVCNTPEEAAAWMKAEIELYGCEYGKDPLDAEYIIKTNIGYMAGYYNHEVAQKIHHLFGAAHPIFGSADYHQTKTPETLLKMGKAFAEAAESADRAEPPQEEKP